jgi:hypothetical protein
MISTSRVTRLPFVLVLLLVLGGCTEHKANPGPPPINKELLHGKWQADNPEQFIQGFEFGTDQAAKMMIWQMKDPVVGAFSWSGNALLIEFQPTEEIQKEYKASLQALKAKLKELGKAMGGHQGEGVAKSADNYPSELPKSQEFHVGFNERPEGITMVLRPPSGQNYRFVKAK